MSIYRRKANFQLLNFISDAGFGVSAPLEAGGTFILRSHHGSGIPLDTYKVTVTPPPQEISEDAMMSGEAPPMPEYPNIPEKYREFSTSGLEFTVQQGDNQFDIEMEP